MTHQPLPATGTVTIGRGEENDIPLEDAAISRRHASIHLDAPLRIKDAGSTNGIRLIVERSGASGTARIEEIRLAPGQCQVIEPRTGIVLGSTFLAVQPRSQESNPPSLRRSRAVMSPIVRDPVMHEIYERVERIARGTVSVLLLGETGVGKEVLAETIHRRSPRAGKPLLCLNCAAFSEMLLESELFGHEAGAFTGAGKAKPGLLEMADGGTVFLDEVGEIPLALQGKLLRAVEERKVLRVGGLKARAVDVRFIAATNRDLEDEVRRGAFRRDLFFRLEGVTLRIPPLRMRRGEIEPLARNFVLAASEQLGQPVPPELCPDAIAALQRYEWAGNIRELRNVIENAVMLCDGEITSEHLELERRSRTSVVPPGGEPAGDQRDRRSDRSSGVIRVPQERATMLWMRRPSPEEERSRICEALEQCAGNQTRAADMLGISRRTMVNRLSEYGLNRPRRKQA
ncbi:sigma 54-interacting transcriptional regulator [Sorangium sp. So ce118]